ncbi:MAG: type VI secretion protein [Gammaproteobacteria bacterium HGW-Gammaproteobacteria-11]|nr:MAG: type VI secretion protein [Gammaproteobacteria bacterium HGW-Gammaproteobacteria-11]
MNKSICSIALLSLAVLLFATGCGTGSLKDYRPLGEPQATSRTN